MFKLALIQMHVQAANRDENLAHASARIQEAAKQSAALVLLPEAMDLGWTDPSATQHAGTIPDGETFKMLQKSARDNNVYVCSGLTEKAGKKVYNSAVLIDPSGKLLLQHRKLNELNIGHSMYAQGDKLNVCETDLGNIGLMICADAFAKDSVITRSLGYMGADIILSPCSWAVDADNYNTDNSYGDFWIKIYGEVCKEFSLWIAATSNVGKIPDGPWQGKKCIGNSMVINHAGEVAAVAAFGQEADTISYVNIDAPTRPARGCNWEAFAP